MALDVSKASTGVAIGDATAPPRTFAASFTGPRPQVCFDFFTWLNALVGTERPALIAYEAALMFSKEGSAETARLLLSLSTVVELIAMARRLEFHAVPVQTWRKSFLGHGRPDEPKAAALAMCELIGWETGGVHDRAEAAGLWAHAHLHYGSASEVRRLLSGASVRRMENRA